MLRAWIVILFANLVLGAPATLVPRISSASGYQLEPQNDKYTLSIRHPDGNSWRVETAQQIAPGVLEVKGTLNQAFEDQRGTLIVTYEAGPNGYVAKYSYSSLGGPTQPVFTVFLSPTVLKSAAG